MNRHQVLTGAANAGDRCFAVGSVEGKHFTAYASGCNIVILASDFQRVQIIPGTAYGAEEISCISCCSEVGKIAASCRSKVYVFEPTPLLHRDSSHKLDYQWYHTGTIEVEGDVLVLTWNYEGTRLLTSGLLLQLWQMQETETGRDDSRDVEFFIEDKDHLEQTTWNCIWHCRPSNPVTTAKFSSDSLLFATIGENDRLVKIWYETQKLQLSLMRSDSVSPKSDQLTFSFVYIAHPRAVTGLSWRKTSKYMQKGTIANVLLTSCKDNICRVWCETVLPDDGLVDVQQLDAGVFNSPLLLQSHRNKKRFMQRLQHVRHMLIKRKRSSLVSSQSANDGASVAGSLTTHDVHKFGMQATVAPAFHFHLAASINPKTDIPLMSPLGNGQSSGSNFVIHWLNNKEFYSTLEAEKIIEEMSMKTSGADTAETGSDGGGGPTSDLNSPANMKPSNGIGTIGSEPLLNEVQRKSKPNLQNMKSYMSVDSEKSASASIKGSADDRSESIASQDCNKVSYGMDQWEGRIERLIQDWHLGSDMLFSVHPVDGSFLMWLVEYLDEPYPGSFRQAQVSFSSLLPAAFPNCDATTMESNLWLYCDYEQLTTKSSQLNSDPRTSSDITSKPPRSSRSSSSAKRWNTSGGPSPHVGMVTKHTNGSLNIWQIGFAEDAHFSSVVSVTHESRACGHRFHTHSAVCHPVLPLLLTTSHLDAPVFDADGDEELESHGHPSSLLDPNSRASSSHPSHVHNEGFCSELILWRVSPIGPLSKSGGITELARINSPVCSAYTNVAWLPTLLPSSSLGSKSNSPSALFVASDGVSLRIYQAVLDGRAILAEQETGKHKQSLVECGPDSLGSEETVSHSPLKITSSPDGMQNLLRIVSLQSTSRPGCIVELLPITEATQSWKNIQLIHVFQEQLVAGCRSTAYDLKAKNNVETTAADLQSPSSVFEEHFYLVVIEKTPDLSAVIHMWKIIVASHEICVGVDYTHDTIFVQEDETDADELRPSSGPSSYSGSNHHPSNKTEESGQHQGQESASPPLFINTVKVSTQTLPLPSGVGVSTATVAAGHLSSSSIYPACFAPYLISTACTDGCVRFWRCEVTRSSPSEGVAPGECSSYTWKEWEMMIQTEDTSSIYVGGKVLAVSCAYSGRIAVAFRSGGIRTRAESPHDQYVNLCVAIYQCESTGGSEWTLEDKIELKNVVISDPKIELDLSLIFDGEFDSQGTLQSPVQNLVSPTSTTPAITRSVPVPSSATVKSVRRHLSIKSGKTVPLLSKHLVHLDWVSTEDGSHILTVGVGSQVLLYAAVSGELASVMAEKEVRDDAPRPRPTARGPLQKTKSMAVMTFVPELRWMKLRSIDLNTADGLPSLPMHISWVRNGILVVGMDNEIHVYSQWKIPGEEALASDGTASVELDPRKSILASSTSFLMPLNTTLSKSLSGLKLNASIANLSILAEKKEKRKDSRVFEATELPKSESFCSLRIIQECGLFEAAHLANPCLPQYHPKQLIELLNFGQIRRVKAILSHLLRCIGGGDSNCGTDRTGEHGGPGGWHRAVHNRNLSVTSPKSPVDGIVTIHEESQTDYLEISSIPPLPLYALLAADDDISFSSAVDMSTTGMSNQTTSKNDDYNSLFNFETAEDVIEDPFDLDDPLGLKPVAEPVVKKVHSPNSFSPAQASLLARHLVHTQLPGMSSLDQMYLLALAETVANFKVDFAGSEVVSKNEDSMSETKDNEMVVPEAIDDCGLRFLLAARHHIYLMNTLPMRQRAQLQQQGLSPAYYIWAFHSESQQELLDSLPCMNKGSPTWAELRQFGAGWWLRNLNTLTRCVEKLAKEAFVASKDPLDAALFYLAMKKKNVLWGLFRSVDNTKMSQFFKNNFTEERWRKAALKNAFVLLGKQKFHHAAAFFLLGGAVRDAVEVCLTKLDDLQLALVILRLYESDIEDSVPSGFKSLLYEEIHGCDETGQRHDPSRPSSDPFLRSMAYWILKDYSSALSTLLTVETPSIASQIERKSSRTESLGTNLSVFNFYNYLRTHPLLVRQHLAATAADNSQTVLLSGFSYGSKISAGEKNVTYVDRITPAERRLYFMTAHEHFKNGCPMLALEVLNKLPDIINLESEGKQVSSADGVPHKSSSVMADRSRAEAGKAEAFATAGSVDWSIPVTESASGFDWSAPVTKFAEDEELELKFQSSSEEEEEEADGKREAEKAVVMGDKPSKLDADVDVPNNGAAGCDIMAQQLKFIACIKIMVIELATLATGFEVDGGQLRYQLYIWLEKEVEVLRKLCNYGSDLNSAMTYKAPAPNVIRSDEAADAFKAPPQQSEAAGLTLHDIMLAEKSDFDAKMNRNARRKKWLKANQQLLSTLLSYGVLHGSCGGGLASMHMELLLLLQELQQEKTRQQLLSPLPFPTTLPLLSASVASAKMVIADPIQHLQGMCQDLLHSIIELQTPPNTDMMPSKVILLQNLSAALSACIYQCLCDSDRFVVSVTDSVSVGMEGFTSTSVVYRDSYLMAGVQNRHRLSSSDNTDLPTSLPAKWPGVSSLIMLMNQKRDEDAPRLIILLTESLVAVYMSLLCYALAMFDAIILYRLIGHPLIDNVWPVLFGGGLKKLVRVSTPVDVSRGANVPPDDGGSWQRSKLASVVLGPSTPAQRFKEDRPTYQERFVPPQMSMVSFFMMKIKNTDHPGVDYDSAESISSQDEDEEPEDLVGTSRRDEAAMNEHLNPKSYSWCLMRYAIVRYVFHSLKTFLPKVGMELSDLPAQSPLIHGIMKNLDQWEAYMKEELDRFLGPPASYIPGCYINNGCEGVNIMKYSSLMDPANTPFISTHYSSRPAKRLWHYLVNCDYLQDVFIHYVFRKRKALSEVETTRVGDSVGTESEPMKIIHKDQDVMTSFCINQVNLNCLVVATQKEVVEMDVSRVLNPPSWINDDIDYDIEVIRNPINQPERPEDFLVVRTPFDGRIGAGSPVGSNAGSVPSGLTGNVSKGFIIPGITNPNMSFYIADRSRRLIRRLLRRPVSGVRRVAAHPQLPYYLTGSQDGCVRLWEWGHSECISEPRKPGAFPKTTKVLFNSQGNKFGVSDTEGAVCLWQVGLGLSMNKPYLSLKCHSKVTNDFVFVGSSSLLATSGQSTDNRNVCLWDTLLPKRKALVQAFHCHNDGCPALVYAPQHQVIISGGRKGEVYIFDIRQRQLRQTFQAHDSAIKCMTINSTEECFVTGSADGDVKVWGLAVHNLMYAFTGEHSKGSSLFRNASSGVMQVYLSPLGHLFSCGTDGSLKVHQMAHKRGIVNTWNA